MNTNIPSLLFKEATASQSLLGNLVLSELEAFQIKTMQTIEKTSSADSLSYYINPQSNGVLIPVSPDMASYTALLKNRRTFSWKRYEYIFSNVTSKILTLSGKFKFEQALLEIEKFRLKAGPHFYGAVLRGSSSKLINPFHILTPISYMKHPEKFEGDFQVLLYFYSNRSKAEKDLGNPTSDTKDYLNDLLSNIIKCSNHKAETKIPNNIENFMDFNRTSSVRNLITSSEGQSLSNLRINVVSADEISDEAFEQIDYRTTSLSNSSSSDSMLLSAHQIMVNGIFAPEYGVSLLKKSSRGLYGTFLTPSASCNIQSSSLNSNLTWAGVCTGRESQRTFEGISSLHCSNYASAYNSSSHSDGSITLADLSILRSVEIYQKIGLLSIPLSDTPSEEEIKQSSDFMQYLEYMTLTFKLDLPQIEARYQTIIGQTNGQKETTPSSDLPEHSTDSSDNTTELPF